MIIRSFADDFGVADWTEEVNVIPNQWGTIGQLGIFREEPVAEHVVYFEEIIRDGALLVDRVRGDRGTQGKDATRKIHTFAIPHFPHDDYISPQDIQGRRAYGNPSAAETLAAVRVRKMERIRQNHAWTLERARAQALVLGTVYAPNGTVSQDWFAEFGITRKTIDFLLGTSTTEVIAKIEEGLAHIQDNAFGTNYTDTVVLCSPEFFAKLISHASVKTAYMYYSRNQDPLASRLGGISTRHRTFEFGGTTFIEMRDTLGGTIGAGTGTRLIPAQEAYMVIRGSDAFKTYFGPANRFEFVNTLGEQVYMFETRDPKGTKIELETETNFVNALLRPATVVKFTTSN
jgi:hypothetical protein